MKNLKKFKYNGNVIVFYLVVICLTLFSFAWADETVDLSENLLKTSDPATFHNFGNNGFAIFDEGDQKLKFFNWSFKLINSFPISRGEGPGQIMQTVLSAEVINDKIYLIGLMENKIKVFDKKGTFLNSFNLDMLPKKMVIQDNQLLLFSMRLNAGEDSFLLGKVINPVNGTVIKNITLTGKLVSEKLFDGNPAMIGLSSLFDVAENKKIYILVSAASTLCEIAENGSLLQKVKLPYKERKDIRTVERNGETKTVLSILDWYIDMKVIKNTVYACFLKEAGKDSKTGQSIFDTHVLKIKNFNDGKHSEKVFANGSYVIIGENKGKIYLFDTYEYKVVASPLSEWR